MVPPGWYRSGLPGLFTRGNLDLSGPAAFRPSRNESRGGQSGEYAYAKSPTRKHSTLKYVCQQENTLARTSVQTGTYL